MKIALFGVGNYTEVLIELCIDCGYSEIDLFHFNTERVGNVLSNCKVVGTYDDFITNKDYNTPVAVAIGDNKIRGEWLDKLRDLGFKTPNLIHPQAYISKSAKIMESCYIHANAFVWTKTKIGNNCILSPNSMLSHHSTIGESCFVTSNAMVGTYVTVKNFVMFGFNSSTLPKSEIEIGSNVIIGANSLVTKSVPDNKIVAGCPAKIIRKNE